MNIKQLVADALPEIARSYFSWIQPTRQYLVVGPGKAAVFTNQRLMAGVPWRVVGHDGAAEQLPIRDHMIYAVTDSGADNNEVATGWVDSLVDDQIAVLKYGQELTVEDIWACAYVDVLARLEDTFG